MKPSSFIKSRFGSSRFQSALPAIGMLCASTMVLAPLTASADRVRVGVGIGFAGPGAYYYGGPGYGRPGPYYYGGPSYYYPPAYYYGPGYDYPPQAFEQPVPETEYAPPPSTAIQAPPAFWYYCAPARGYFPYVSECQIPWQAVAAPRQAANRNLRPAPAPAGKVTYRLGDVLFATAQAQLQSGAESTLDALLTSINGQPNRHFVIEGHTDAVGRSTDNLNLSRNRAETVKQYLIAHGVAADRVTAIGKGEAEPVASNDTAEGRKQNRRVDIIVS